MPSPHESHSISPEPRLATLDYLAAVAKDWAMNTFAAARDSEFTFTAHRFSMDGSTVRRRRVPRQSSEAENPLAAAGNRRTPTAWARCDTVTLLADCVDGASHAYKQEIVEIIGVEEDDVVAEAAMVVRIPGLPPCLGRFWSVV